MSGMAGMMMEPAAWTAGYAGLMFAMWWVMMAAMMLPSAAPILLLFALVNRAERAGNRPYVPTGIFAAGYLAARGGFSALATELPEEQRSVILLAGPLHRHLPSFTQLN
jgi:predicted metal-binding membrane protein